MMLSYWLIGLIVAASFAVFTFIITPLLVLLLFIPTRKRRKTESIHKVFERLSSDGFEIVATDIKGNVLCADRGNGRLTLITDENPVICTAHEILSVKITDGSALLYEYNSLSKPIQYSPPRSFTGICDNVGLRITLVSGEMIRAYLFDKPCKRYSDDYSSVLDTVKRISDAVNDVCVK